MVLSLPTRCSNWRPSSISTFQSVQSVEDVCSRKLRQDEAFIDVGALLLVAVIVVVVIVTFIPVDFLHVTVIIIEVVTIEIEVIVVRQSPLLKDGLCRIIHTI